MNEDLKLRIEKAIKYLEKTQKELEERHNNGYDPNLLASIKILQGEDNE